MSEARPEHDSGKASAATLASARAAHYRTLERRQVRRLLDASECDTSHMVGVSDMMRLKAAHYDLWTHIFVAHRAEGGDAIARPVDHDGSLRRDRMRLNNRVARQRQKHFVAEVERRLVAAGRLLPESEYVTAAAPPASLTPPTAPEPAFVEKEPVEVTPTLI